MYKNGFSSEWDKTKKYFEKEDKIITENFDSSYSKYVKNNNYSEK